MYNVSLYLISMELFDEKTFPGCAFIPGFSLILTLPGKTESGAGLHD